MERVNGFGPLSSIYYFNGRHSNINFTIEHEVDGRLSFLDCSVQRCRNKFTSSVYRKPTFPGLGISFFSFCSFRFEINSIKTLLFRAYNLSANYHLMHLEFDFLRNFFVSNGFPLNLVESQISKFLSKRFSDTTSLTNAKPNFYISIPYFGSQSEKLSRELSRLLSKYIPHYNFIIIQVNRHKIGSLFNYKDRLPSFMRSSLVYRFSCARCACEYVGSTTRLLHTRVCEHIGKSHRTGLPLSAPQHSNVRLHCDHCRVSASETDFSILSGCERNSETLRILESMYISKLKPSINDLNSAHKLLVCN